MTNTLGCIDSDELGLGDSRPRYDGACIIQSPMRMWLAYACFSTSAFGLYNKVLAQSMSEILLRHEAVMKDRVKSVCGVDIKKTIEIWQSDPNRHMTMRNLDDTFTHKLFGYESTDDYWTRSSAFYSIEKIRTPTLFLNAKDDPIIGTDTLEYSVFRKNPYTALATTEHGGHLGYHEGIFAKSKIWIFNPILGFLQALKES